MEQSIDLSIVLPVFNEEKNIAIIMERYKQLYQKNNRFELIFIEDTGSTDNTRGEIKKAAKDHSFVKYLFIEERGYGISIFNGLKEAKGDYLCWTHADMQTDPADTIKALDIIKKQKNPGACFIKGNRKKRPFIDTFFAFGMSVFETTILRKILYDINAQPNLFHKSFLEKIPNPPHDFSFDLYFYYIAKDNNYKIIRFPVLFPKRIHGESHWNTTLKSKWKFIKRTFDFTVKLKRRMKKNN